MTAMSTRNTTLLTLFGYDTICTVDGSDWYDTNAYTVFESTPRAQRASPAAPTPRGRPAQQHRGGGGGAAERDGGRRGVVGRQGWRVRACGVRKGRRIFICISDFYTFFDFFFKLFRPKQATQVKQDKEGDLRLAP